MKSKGGSGAATTAVPPPVNFPTWKSSKRTTSKGGAASKSNGQRDKRWGDFAAEINPTSSSSHNDKTSGSKGKSTKGNGISNIFERDNPDDERVERINQLWSMIAAARRDDRFDDNETIDRDIQQQPNYVNINDRWRNTQQSNNP